MDKFISINQWINEQKIDEPQYGCVMMEPKKIDGWEENHLDGIKEDNVYIKPYDESYGLEYEPHVTILYGIHEDEIDPSVVVDLIEQKFKPVIVTISDIDVFQNDEYDVVVYKVPVTEQLQEYRDLLMESFANTQTFKGYHPHMTIAYVKKGTGKKYKKKLNEPFDVRFVKGVYSYHKDDPDEKEDDTVRRVVNLEPKKEEKKSSGIVNSKPLNKTF